MPHSRHLPPRRAILLAAIAACLNPTRSSAASGPEVSETLNELERAIGGRLGVFVLDTSTRLAIEHRPDERFAMCSTFKWLLAAQLLHQADIGAASLKEQIEFNQGDLLEYAPVARAKVRRGRMSLSEAAAAAVVLSDNTAANLLLGRLGGPPAFTEFARSLGDTITRLDRLEPDLNSNTPQDSSDTTSPRAMVASLEAALLGNSLSPRSRRQLLGWLRASETGYARLRAGLPRSWRVGDKTGTGSNGAVNNIAIAFPPGRKPLLFAVYISDTQAARGDLERAHARVANLAAATLT